MPHRSCVMECHVVSLQLVQGHANRRAWVLCSATQCPTGHLGVIWPSVPLGRREPWPSPSVTSAFPTSLLPWNRSMRRLCLSLDRESWGFRYFRNHPAMDHRVTGSQHPAQPTAAPEIAGRTQLAERAGVSGTTPGLGSAGTARPGPNSTLTARGPPAVSGLLHPRLLAGSTAPPHAGCLVSGEPVSQCRPKLPGSRLHSIVMVPQPSIPVISLHFCILPSPTHHPLTNPPSPLVPVFAIHGAHCVSKINRWHWLLLAASPVLPLVRVTFFIPLPTIPDPRSLRDFLWRIRLLTDCCIAPTRDATSTGRDSTSFDYG